VRERSRLCQSDVEGLSERQLGRTERGEQRATARTLDALARAHGMTTSEYMDVVAEALPEPYGRES
jgi:hypothetical protein